MQISKRVIQLAKERALFGFSMLAQNMVSEAHHNLQRPSQSLKTAADPKDILDASYFLQRDGRFFIERLLTFYGDYLERAMQTMYTDLRTGLHNMSADRLSLIDDDTMNRQIEVDRLVLRMRDIDHENLGRLNIIIAQLHGDHDVRERENPFRPYLLARSLHEVLNNMVKNEAVAKLLFDALSDVLVARLPGFFAAIREVFESNGIRSRLLARPASLTRRQREMLRRRTDKENFHLEQTGFDPEEEMQPSRDSGVRVQSGLKRVFETQKTVTSKGEESHAFEDPRKQAVAFQDFVWQMFNQKRPAHLPHGASGMHGREALDDNHPKAVVATVSSALSAQLMQVQKDAARKGLGAGERNRLAALREKIDTAKITAAERITLDVVALLFEFIFQDAQIPVDLRNEIGRLQVPFLRAAMLTPELLQQPAHPVRMLLNRLGSVAAALDMGLPADHQVSTEISATIDRVMERFEDDMSVFTDCLEEFEHFLHTLYRNTDQATISRADAVEEAEKASVMLFNIGNTLRDLLPPLDIDRRVAEFIMQTWARVLAVLLVRFAENEALVNQYRVILPELAWSVQPGHKPQERNALMRMLPELVKRLKKGMELACVPEEESKKALDQLADVHMQILRGTVRPSGKKGMTLEDLYQHFSLLQVCEGSHLWTENEPLTVQRETVHAAFASRAVKADLRIQTEAIPALATDEDWMAQMRLGIGAEIKIGEMQDLVRLVWVSEQRSLFVFVVEGNGQSVVYTTISLLKALRDGVLRPLEYAPLFERAVESLMVGAESLQAA